MKQTKLLVLMATLLAIPSFGDTEKDEQDRKFEKERQEMKLEKEKWEMQAEKEKNEAKGEAEKNKKQAELETEKKKRMNPYRVELGLQGGMAISSASIESGATSSSRLGFTLGGLAEAPLLPGFLYIQPEINFVQKGAENLHFGSLAAAKLSYLEFPLLAKLKFTLPKVRPFLVAGPSMAYLVSSTLEGAGVTAGLDRFKKLEFNLILGGGICFQMGDSLESSEVSVSARYSSGLNDAATTGGKWRSDAFSLLVGIQI